jgi:hypothetical protein
MGFVENFGTVGSSEPDCPICHTALKSDGTYGRGYACPNCADGTVYRVEDGNLNGYRSSGGGERTCERCQSSLSRGDHYLPYEDGSNSHAYIICPVCKHKNIQHGFGEDD